MAEQEQKEEIRYIVRIAGKDLDGNKPIIQALRGIRGVSHRYAGVVASKFEKESGTKADARLGKVPEDQDKILEDIVLNPGKHGIPEWMINQRNERESGKDQHWVMGDLEFGLRQNIKRLNEIKSYRGLRHSWGLTVRGQRTRSSFRGKGRVVGVHKRDAKGGGGGKAKEQSASQQATKQAGKTKK